MTIAADADGPRVVVAIVSTDEAHNLVGCLTSLAASAHRRFQVVICENGGAAGFARTVSELTALPVMRAGADDAGAERIVSPHPHRCLSLAGGQRVTVLQPPANLGYAGGVNACIAATTDWDAIWVLNPDTFPEPEALVALVRRQQEGGYGVVGSRLLFVATGLVQTWGGLEWYAWLGRGRLIGWNKAAETVPDIAAIERRFGFISGASMYVSRAYIEKVGVMDEDFFVYDEDVEWCLRRGAFKLGYAHGSVVRHIHGATSGSSLNKASRSRFNTYLTERNRLLLARKQFGAAWYVAALLGLAQIVEQLVRVRSLRQFRIALAGWWAGICGETGMPGFLRAAGNDRSDLRKVSTTA